MNFWGRSGRWTAQSPSEGVSPSPWFKRAFLQLFKTELRWCFPQLHIHFGKKVWWIGGCLCCRCATILRWPLGTPMGTHPKTGIHKPQSALGLWFTSAFLMAHSCYCSWGLVICCRGKVAVWWEEGVPLWFGIWFLQHSHHVISCGKILVGTRCPSFSTATRKCNVSKSNVSFPG